MTQRIEEEEKCILYSCASVRVFMSQLFDSALWVNSEPSEWDFWSNLWISSLCKVYKSALWVCFGVIFDCTRRNRWWTTITVVNGAVLEPSLSRPWDTLCNSPHAPPPPQLKTAPVLVPVSEKANLIRTGFVFPYIYFEIKVLGTVLWSENKELIWNWAQWKRTISVIKDSFLKKKFK